LELALRLYADGWVIYRKIRNDSHIENFQVDLQKFGKWTVKNALQIILGGNKAQSFSRARVKDPLNYFGGTKEFRRRVAAYI
jgi:hypothetical protein